MPSLLPPIPLSPSGAAPKALNADIDPMLNVMESQQSSVDEEMLPEVMQSSVEEVVEEVAEEPMMPEGMEIPEAEIEAMLTTLQADDNE